MGTWQKYIDYLMDWAREHAHPDFQGMSPACYDEWLENEGEEGYNGEILTNEEFQRRCEKVFIANKNDVFYDIYIIENQVCILMDEMDDENNPVSFVYKPDMSMRPQALDYLLGRREDFND